jgi:hypothetical protein
MKNIQNFIFVFTAKNEHKTATQFTILLLLSLLSAISTAALSPSSSQHAGGYQSERWDSKAEYKVGQQLLRTLPGTFSSTIP